jgi:hypothetical protein
MVVLVSAAGSFLVRRRGVAPVRRSLGEGGSNAPPILEKAIRAIRNVELTRFLPQKEAGGSS